MKRPIGLFDSGVGGLTVMREISKQLPHEDLIYFADTANLPYGNKSAEQITKFSQHIAQFLLEKNIKLLVIACHTASAYAADILKQTLPIPVICVTDAALILTKEHNQIAILATEATLKSNIYPTNLAIACPLFVHLAEEGLFDHPTTISIAKSYLEPLIGKVDAALLGCTHYPLLIPSIEKAIGNKMALLDPAPKTAQLIKAYLEEHKLLNPQTTQPTYEYFASGSKEIVEQKYENL